MWLDWPSCLAPFNPVLWPRRSEGAQATTSRDKWDSFRAPWEFSREAPLLWENSPAPGPDYWAVSFQTLNNSKWALRHLKESTTLSNHLSWKVKILLPTPWLPSYFFSRAIIFASSQYCYLSLCPCFRKVTKAQRVLFIFCSTGDWSQGLHSVLYH